MLFSVQWSFCCLFWLLVHALSLTKPHTPSDHACTHALVHTYTQPAINSCTPTCMQTNKQTKHSNTLHILSRHAPIFIGSCHDETSRHLHTWRPLFLRPCIAITYCHSSSQGSWLLNSYIIWAFGQFSLHMWGWWGLIFWMMKCYDDYVDC